MSVCSVNNLFCCFVNNLMVVCLNTYPNSSNIFALFSDWRHFFLWLYLPLRLFFCLCWHVLVHNSSPEVSPSCFVLISSLRDNLRDNTCSDRTTAFSNCKSLLLFHCNRSKQFHLKLYGIARHHH